MQHQEDSQQTDKAPEEKVRLHYLDWLRVLAIFGVFLFHAFHPFDQLDWHIKNTEQSLLITVIIVLLGLWGMPFFFLIAGTGTWFALQRRTSRQYITERFKRLFIPFICGSILFTPIMLYFEWMHKTSRDLFQGSFLEFVIDRNVGLSPMWFGVLGYHLWFLGFLFSFSVLALPLFLWIKKKSGGRLLSQIAKLCENTGGIMVFLLPLLVVKLSLQPFFPLEHDWADFFFQLTFFAIGYILFTDKRFTKAIQRDWLLIFALAIITIVILVAMFLFGDPFSWAENPSIPEFYLVQSTVTVNAWCWTIFLLYIGIRFLDFSNNLLQFSKEAVLPFFMVHQPIIIVIAFFVVQWDVIIAIKVFIVVIGSFIVSIALYEWIIKRISLFRVFFGMKAKKSFDN